MSNKKLISESEYKSLSNKEKDKYDTVITDECVNSDCKSFGVQVTYNTKEKPHGIMYVEGPVKPPALDGKEVIMKTSFHLKQICGECLKGKKIVKTVHQESNENEFNFFAPKAIKDRGNNFYKDYSIKESDIKTDPEAGKNASTIDKKEYEKIAKNLSKTKTKTYGS